MDINNMQGGSSSLPSQKLPMSAKNTAWKHSTIDYYINFRYTNGTSLRSDRVNKITNYDLYNGKINHADVEKICDPLGYTGNTWADRFQHYDKTSEPIRLLIGEESTRPDNAIVISESPTDLSRKSEGIKRKMIEILEQNLMAEIDPTSVDPNNPPLTPEQVLKAEKYSPSDMIESKANKILKILKKKLNTKWNFNQGFKDVLIAGEEIYWSGIVNGEPAFRKCNPLNITVILDDDSVFIDDAIAIIEERMLTVPSILDEYGDDLTASDLDKLQEYAKGIFGRFNTAGGFDPVFTVAQNSTVMSGVTPNSSFNGNNNNNYALRVTRVEWVSMKKVGTLMYTDIETGQPIEKLVDETFASVWKDFKQVYTDAELEWFWINEVWEGNKIGHDIYIGVRPKPNQRRRMDNPYYCKTGYDGFISEATNSQSVSLVDRIKPYQYLYDIIAFRLELAFASDQGKVFLMDVAQIPQSEGIDMERWLYYLKEMKIGFINSHEEGKKGSATGKLPTMNQFTSIDLSLAQSIQQYINYLDYIQQQIYYVSGITPQRLGDINSSELVGNTERAVNQSSLITEYLFEAHQEVKRRVYTSLIEVAKLAWRKGKVTQFMNDDLGIEMLNLEEFEFENSEFGVFVSNLNKDKLVKDRLDQLAQIAIQSEKADLSTIIDTILNDSPKDIVAILRKSEEDFYARKQQEQQSQQEMQAQQIEAQKQMHAEDLAERQKDRDLQQYIADSNNQTKIQIAEINTYIGQENLDQDNDGIPDPLELGKLALEERDLAAKQFLEQQKISQDKDKHSKDLALKDRELKLKQDIENKKIEAIRVQNQSQEKIAKEANALKKEEMKNKLAVEKLKIQAARAKAANKPKPKK